MSDRSSTKMQTDNFPKPKPATPDMEHEILKGIEELGRKKKNARTLAKHNKQVAQNRKLMNKAHNEAETCRADALVEMNKIHERLAAVIRDVQEMGRRYTTRTGLGPAIIRDHVANGMREVIGSIIPAEHALMKTIAFQSDGNAILINVMKDFEARNKEAMTYMPLARDFGYSEDLFEPDVSDDEKTESVPVKITGKKTPKASAKQSE